MERTPNLRTCDSIRSQPLYQSLIPRYVLSVAVIALDTIVELTKKMIVILLEVISHTVLRPGWQQSSPLMGARMTSITGSSTCDSITQQTC